MEDNYYEYDSAPAFHKMGFDKEMDKEYDELMKLRKQYMQKVRTEDARAKYGTTKDIHKNKTDDKG